MYKSKSFTIKTIFSIFETGFNSYTYLYKWIVFLLYLYLFRRFEKERKKLV